MKKKEREMFTNDRRSVIFIRRINEENEHGGEEREEEEGEDGDHRDRSACVYI